MSLRSFVSQMSLNCFIAQNVNFGSFAMYLGLLFSLCLSLKFNTTINSLNIVCFKTRQICRFCIYFPKYIKIASSIRNYLLMKFI